MSEAHLPHAGACAGAGSAKRPEQAGLASSGARDSSPGAGALPRVVVVGAGFAGLEVARELGKAGVPVTLVDRHNHHLFQPLLYQVATAALSSVEVAEPIRKILRRYKSVEVLFDEVADIDSGRRELVMTGGRRLGYDYLVVTSGAGHSYFGHDEWARWAPGLKTIEDARRIRSRLLVTFEQAERTDDPEEQRRLLSVAVIGGGPTGVELAGSIAELSRYTLARDFRNIQPESMEITLVEAGPRLLPGFSEELAEYAKRRLEGRGVIVRTGESVDAVTATSLSIGGEPKPIGFVIWAAGVAASPLGARLGVETDKSGRVPVDATLAVRGLERVFALGDVAALEGKDGKPLPGLAQVAKQQGAHLGRSLAAHVLDGAPLRPFHYKGRGNTAIVGRHAAVFEQGDFKVKGTIAWLSWAVIHVFLLVGFQNRVIVSLQWLWRYLTYDRGARLITGMYAAEAWEASGSRPAPEGR